MSGLSAFPRAWSAKLRDLTEERDRQRERADRMARENETLLRNLDEERRRNAALELRLGGGGMSARDQAVATTDGPPRGDRVAWVRRGELIQAAHRVHVLERHLEELADEFGFEVPSSRVEGERMDDVIAAGGPVR